MIHRKYCLETPTTLHVKTHSKSMSIQNYTTKRTLFLVRHAWFSSNLFMIDSRGKDLGKLTSSWSGKINIYSTRRKASRLVGVPEVNFVTLAGNQAILKCNVQGVATKSLFYFTLTVDIARRKGNIILQSNSEQLVVARIRESESSKLADYLVDIVAGVDVAFISMLCLALEMAMTNRKTWESITG